jgi:hypothetical protein
LGRWRSFQKLRRESERQALRFNAKKQSEQKEEWKKRTKNARAKRKHLEKGGTL